MGLFSKKKKSNEPKLVVHKHTFDMLTANVEPEPAPEIIYEKPKETYEDFLQNLSGEQNSEEKMLLDKYQEEEFEHFKIKELDYDAFYDDTPEEIGFDDSFDVNETKKRKVALIKKVIKGQDKLDALLGTAEVLKPKWK